MLKTIALYYNDELENWEHTLGFYQNELMKLEYKLNIIINENTIPNRALSAEKLLNELLTVQHEMIDLYRSLNEQYNAVNTDNLPLDDMSITSDINKTQDILRSRIMTCEKNYMNAKHECYNFLSQLLKK